MHTSHFSQDFFIWYLTWGSMSRWLSRSPWVNYFILQKYFCIWPNFQAFWTIFPSFSYPLFSHLNFLSFSASLSLVIKFVFAICLHVSADSYFPKTDFSEIVMIKTDWMEKFFWCYWFFTVRISSAMYNFAEFVEKWYSEVCWKKSDVTISWKQKFRPFF